jgi:formate/nitrite transporter
VAELDALLPPEIAAKAEDLGVQKARTPAFPLFALAVLAGAFISLGALLSTVVAISPGFPYGVTRLLVGLSFSVGLVLVVGAGAELFTGNNLIAIAWASRRIAAREILRSWAIVYAGNFCGAIGTVILVDLASVAGDPGGVGGAAIRIAAQKCEYPPLEAFASGILCNALVCLAVWMNYGARSLVDRFVAVVFPVTAFAAIGFEHSIANMYLIPAGIFAAADLDPVAVSLAVGTAPGWGGFLRNLVPVTLGNIVGGTLLVATVYWAVYRRGRGGPAAR